MGILIAIQVLLLSTNQENLELILQKDVLLYVIIGIFKQSSMFSLDLKFTSSKLMKKLKKYVKNLRSYFKNLHYITYKDKVQHGSRN